MPTKILRDPALLYPLVRSKAIRMIAEANGNGMRVAIFETLRTEERQRFLQGQGTSSVKIGWHMFGLALDIWPILDNGKWPGQKEFAAWPHWKKLSDLGAAYGFVSGGSWHDWPHFQMTFGLNKNKLYSILQEEGQVGVTAYIDAQLKGAKNA